MIPNPMRGPWPTRFRLPDRTPPFDVSVDDDGCVVCEGPANGRLYCEDHRPVYEVGTWTRQTDGEDAS